MYSTSSNELHKKLTLINNFTTNVTKTNNFVHNIIFVTYEAIYHEMYTHTLCFTCNVDFTSQMFIAHETHF